MGLILKCREMRENMRHCAGSSSHVRIEKEKTDLEILYKIVEDAQPFWIFAVLDVDQ
jgi:hypothetical protein